MKPALSKLLYLSLLVPFLFVLAACGAADKDMAGNNNSSAANTNSNSAAVQENQQDPAPDKEDLTEAPVHQHVDEPAAGKEEPQKTDVPKAPPAKNSAPPSSDSPAKEQAKPKPAETPSPDKSQEQQEKKSQVLTVEITNFAFSPSKLEIKKGDVVKFVNKDAVRHSATSDDDSFDTGLLDQDAEQSVTFSEAGQFSYHCTPHPGMKGTIIVSDE